MPTYEYQCDTCGHRFEKFQSITAKHPKSCPQCGKKIRKLISAGGAVITKTKTAPGPQACSHCDMDAPSCGQDFPCAGGPCPM